MTGRDAGNERERASGTRMRLGAAAQRGLPSLWAIPKQPARYVHSEVTVSKKASESVPRTRVARMGGRRRVHAHSIYVQVSAIPCLGGQRRRTIRARRRAHRDLPVAIFALTPPAQTESKIEISLRYITACRSAFIWLSLSLHEAPPPLSRPTRGPSFHLPVPIDNLRETRCSHPPIAIYSDPH